MSSVDFVIRLIWSLDEISNGFFSCGVVYWSWTIGTSAKGNSFPGTFADAFAILYAFIPEFINDLLLKS